MNRSLTILLVSFAIALFACGDENEGADSVVIDSADGGCFWFADGSTDCAAAGASNEPDIMVEPWCTDNPGICGNWVDTGETSLSAVTTPPADGYTSDVAGFTDCQEVTVGNVLVFKLADGSHAKAVIKIDDYTQGTGGCDHRITMDYVYPM